MEDQALVAAISRRDPTGLDGAYRRYAPRLYAYARTLVGDAATAADVVQDTFLIAARHVTQLRDPTRLRPWLFSVARNECLRQLRGRVRVVPLEAYGPGVEPAAEPTDPGAAVQSGQLVELVRAAYGGLGEADREVIELTVRHGLSAADLAGVLGVSDKHAHARISRARAQFAVSLGALLVARTGRTDCPVLAGLLTDWDGALTPLLRKRIHRHTESCPTCGAHRRRQLNPAALLTGYAALPLAALLPLARQRLDLVAAHWRLAQPPPALGTSPGPPTGGARQVESPTGDSPAGVGPVGPAGVGPAADGYRWEPRTGFPVRYRAPGDRRRRVGLAAALVLLTACGAGLFAAAGPGAALLPTGSAPVTVSPPAVDVGGTAVGHAPPATGTAGPSPSPGGFADPVRPEGARISPAPGDPAAPDPDADRPDPDAPDPSTPPDPPGPGGSSDDPTPPVRELSVRATARVACTGGQSYAITVSATASEAISAATLTWRAADQRTGRMTVSGRGATGTAPRLTAARATWWVAVTAPDGRTARTSTGTATDPCPRPAG
ncbi:RNA polymerase sigma factor [Solwaraspora sp. WMMD1047]|uniref:RNA polymerase sigma factor n=1 Tax=Solwaraspora sp. WMMD1047 TaxID=3016102 RepID=UPI002416D206|nr:RNA polymerase sigma factor [Solwaraspora sp. WMMD1047]MDG4831216.1 RNA polymerase sigma factor [Solwaraspora sp. WMMD1047]